jgi:hypothetical protein
MRSNDVVTWVLEAGAFSGSNHPLEPAVGRAGQRVIGWDDEWWSTGRWPDLVPGRLPWKSRERGPHPRRSGVAPGSVLRHRSLPLLGVVPAHAAVAHPL